MNLRRYAAAVPASFAILLWLSGCGAENAVAPNSGGSTMTGGSTMMGGSSATAGTGPGGSGAGGAAGASVAGGGAGGSASGSGGTAGGATASFATLKSIIQMSCFGGVCHDLPEHPLQLKVDEKLYGTLTTHMTKTCGPLLKPGSPQDSAFVKLLKGPCGTTERMPLNKCSQDGDEACVTPEHIALIEQWIANGAPQ